MKLAKSLVSVTLNHSLISTGLRLALSVLANMVKSLIFILIVTFILGCRTTTGTFQTSDPNKIGVKANKYKGTIFKSSYPKDKLYIQPGDSVNRFTPTKEDIIVAESILNEQIENINKPP